MRAALLIASSVLAALPAAAGFALPRGASVHSSTRPQLAAHLDGDAAPSEGRAGDATIANRREAIGQAYRTAAAVAASALLPSPSHADIEGVVTIPQSTAPPESTASNVDGKSVTVFKTKSGLQYIEIEEGSGPTPKYGNFVTIAYKAYIKLPNAQGQSFDLDEFDSDKGYLVKHGNGRTVPGLDEGLHTMKVGGKRRIIVPPKLGYVASGLGPIPVGPYGRWKLNRLIDRMVELKGGNVIFDVEMKGMMEDEADQGYYDDDSLSPDDFNTLRKNIEASQQAARAQMS
ncbi:hypothetical protein ACHAXT_001255 [Thalassiosira profunda]